MIARESSKDPLFGLRPEQSSHTNPAPLRKRAVLSDEQAREIFKLRLAAAEQQSVISLFTARSIIVSKVHPHITTFDNFIQRKASRYRVGIKAAAPYG